MYYYIDRDNSADSKTGTSDTDTAEDDETKTENNPLNFAFRLFPIFALILSFKFVIGLLNNFIHSV